MTHCITIVIISFSLFTGRLTRKEAGIQERENAIRAKRDVRLAKEKEASMIGRRLTPNRNLVFY